MDQNSPEKWYQKPQDEEESSSESVEFIPKSPLPKPRGQFRQIFNLRLLFECALVFMLLLLFISGSVHSVQHHGTPEYGPTLPRKSVILGNTAGFGPDIAYNDPLMLTNATRMKEIHRNWQQLFPKGRGYVKLHEKESFEVLHPPFRMDSVLTDGDHYEGYILAVYHQLHCLSILTTALGTSREEWAKLEEQKREHRSHCVEYLRQSILCSADTTLEGETGSWTKSTGWGQTHSCVDFDALTEMANQRAIWDLSGDLLPIDFDPLAVKPADDM
ncbi:hypothetical protein VTL71DRAFT_9423 [Oculimacula yallundae]|uniref:Uncharacterized protein n=1 Tax=Oculimacula yallundae TaxID=86028 RepID=A0ABR4BUJ3_9HELO